MIQGANSTHRIAILLTCFNRKATTLRCLRRALDLAPTADIFLVDDNSTDGTSEAVAGAFPHVHLITGEGGDLFWSRGMHLAWECARAGCYSHYLWLNDDVILNDNCLVELLACSSFCEHQAIISGILESHDGKEILYGGTDSTKRLLLPNGKMQSITNMNGNVVLVPTAVFSTIGNLDPYYHHDLGDVDYGLRARQHDVRVLTSRVTVGSCDKNNMCRVRLPNSKLSNRMRKLYSPLGSPPSANFHFRRKHFGSLNAGAYYLYLHFLNILPDWIVRRIWKGRYGL